MSADVEVVLAAMRRHVMAASKLATARLLGDSMLAAELGLGAVAGRTPGAQALYDVSSSYYEGRSCSLARFGHSPKAARCRCGRTCAIRPTRTRCSGRSSGCAATSAWSRWCCTGRPAERLSAEDAVRSYLDLARVERVFRCLKTVGLPLHSFSTLLDHLATRCRPRRFPRCPLRLRHRTHAASEPRLGTRRLFPSPSTARRSIFLCNQ